MTPELQSAALACEDCGDIIVVAAWERPREQVCFCASCQMDTLHVYESEVNHGL